MQTAQQNPKSLGSGSVVATSAAVVECGSTSSLPLLGLFLFEDGVATAWPEGRLAGTAVESFDDIVSDELFANEVEAVVDTAVVVVAEAVVVFYCQTVCFVCSFPFLGIRSLFFSFAAVNAHRVAHARDNTKCHDVVGMFPLQLLLEAHTISRHLTVVESNLPTPTDDFTGDWSVDTSRLYQKLPICIYVLVWLEFSFMKISDKVTTVSPISNNSCATVKRYQRAVDALSCCFRRTPEPE